MAKNNRKYHVKGHLPLVNVVETHACIVTLLQSNSLTKHNLRGLMIE